MSLTETLRAGDPQAFGTLYDEYAEALYAYCYVMVGVEAGDALRDAFVAVARDPGAVPDDDARLPVWLHSLARAECVRRGAFARSVATTVSTDPPRRALALLSPGHREVLALTNTLDADQTAQVLGVTRQTAETLAWEAQQRLEAAAASVHGQGSGMLAPLSGEALHRLVTLGYEPPSGERERVLSSCAAAKPALGGAAVFDAEGTPSLDAPAAQADDDATQQIPRISPDESATAPLRRIDESSPDPRPVPSEPDEARPAEPASSESGPAEAAELGAESAAWEAIDAAWAEDADASNGEQPVVRGTHAKHKKPSVGGRLLPVVALVACLAAATGAAFALTSSDRAQDTGTTAHQSAKPSGSARPTPSGDRTSPSPKAVTSHPHTSPTPSRTGTAPTTATPRRTTAPAGGSKSSTPTSPAKTTPTTEPTPTAKPTSPAESTPSTEPTSPSESTPTAKPTPSAEPSSPAQPTPTAEPTPSAEPTPTAKPSKTAKPHKTTKPHKTAKPSKTARPTHTPRPSRTAKPTHTARPTRPDTSSERPTSRPRPHRTTTSGDGSTGGRGSVGHRGSAQACEGPSGRASRCAQPYPWRIERPQRPDFPQRSNGFRSGSAQGDQNDQRLPQRSNGFNPGFGQGGQDRPQRPDSPQFAQRPRW
ncbi:hypothetical protein [Actinoallomurus sp. NPDC052274]|uniref:RNA polymerase sigma factor n=1 Tax=Actinoallomurus sp. NPDC052274 TaxID=3155420 RepID=UPI00341C3B73